MSDTHDRSRGPAGSNPENYGEILREERDADQQGFGWVPTPDTPDEPEVTDAIRNPGYDYMDKAQKERVMAVSIYLKRIRDYGGEEDRKLADMFGALALGAVDVAMLDSGAFCDDRKMLARYALELQAAIGDLRLKVIDVDHKTDYDGEFIERNQWSPSEEAYYGLFETLFEDRFGSLPTRVAAGTDKPSNSPITSAAKPPILEITSKILKGYNRSYENPSVIAEKIRHDTDGMQPVVAVYYDDTKDRPTSIMLIDANHTSERNIGAIGLREVSDRFWNTAPDVIDQSVAAVEYEK